MMNKQTQLQWFLVSNCGFSLPLHQTMISLGRENCDVILESQSADGKHAVLTYDHYEKRFKVKDLNTINGTYVNENRIPIHTFVMLQHLDCLRFGFDAVIYQLQGIPRIYTGPNFSYSPSTNIYYPANTSHPSTWSSPFISSQHLIMNKMADCRNCDCKQEIHQQPYIGRLAQSTREPPSSLQSERQQQLQPHNNIVVTKGVVSQQLPVRQDCCGNIVHHSNGVNCNLSEDAKQNHLVEGQTVESNSLKNGHSGVTTSPERLQPLCRPNFLPMVSSQNDDQCLYQANGGTVKLAHSKSTSFEPISKDKNDYKSLGHRELSIDSCPKPETVNFCEDQTKNGSTEMVVMRAEKPYAQSDLKVDCTVNSDEQVNGGGRPSSTAFTVEFEDNRVVSSAPLKKLDIKDSISKFAPPKPDCEVKAGHRRNLSLPKIGDYFSDENGNEEMEEENGCLEKENGKDPIWDTQGLGPSKTKLKENLGPVRGGYLSEGHISSDQDDELSAKSDPTRQPTAAGPNDKISMPKKSHEQKALKNSGRRSLPVTGLRDSAKYLISRMFGEVTAPPSSPSDPPTSSPGCTISKLALNNTNTGIATNLKKGDGKNGSRGSLTSTKTYTVDGREAAKTRNSLKPNLKEVEVEVSEEEDDEECEEECENEHVNDDGSETGTYTIEKEGDNADEVKEARKNIDVVFGVENPATQRQSSDEELKHSPEIVEDKELKSCSPSKPNSSWLKEWAASTLDPMPNHSTTITSFHQGDNQITTTVSASPWVPATPSPSSVSQFASFSSSSTPEAPQRPRRRLPVIPTEKLNGRSPSVHSNGINSLKTGGEANRSLNQQTDSNRSSPEGNRSGSTSMDTETILKETETVVTAMEARMNHQRLTRKEKSGERDSGGESDVDTSTASGTNEVELRPKKLILHKKVAAQLKSQLKSLEDDPCFESRSLSPRTLRRSIMGSVSSQGRTTPTDSVSEVETASIQSDISSSSELSGSSPVSKRKHRESAPLMRFNRAFSLRRARLGCESEPSPPPPPPPTKTGNVPSTSRPNSASSVNSSKGRSGHLNASTCSKSDSGSSSTPAVKKPSRPPPVSANNNNSFNRSDGGRFSLRLPRSALPPARPSSAKAAGSSTSSTPQPTPRVKSAGSNGRSNGTPRSNSTLSAKELELKNWKRRKEYDPLKAAAEGRKKDAKKPSANTSVLSKSESPSPTSTTFHRSASFHGTDALNGGTHLRRNTFSLEDSEIQLDYSTPPDSTPRHSVQDISSDLAGAGGHRSRISRKSSEDELEATRTMSHTDLDNESAVVSPRNSPVSHLHPSIRHKNKVDALDNLVISTVYQLSCHLRGNAEQLLTKIRDSQGRNCDEGANGLNELLGRIALEDSPVSSPQARSVSKQLSGILKNLKRLEESLHVVDQVFDTTPPIKNCQSQKTSEGSASQHYFKDHLAKTRKKDMFK